MSFLKPHTFLQIFFWINGAMIEFLLMFHSIWISDTMYIIYGLSYYIMHILIALIHDHVLRDDAEEVSATGETS